MRATAENPRVASPYGREARCGDFSHLHHWCGAGYDRGCDVGHPTTAQRIIAMGFLPGLKAFTAAVFGGIGNLWVAQWWAAFCYWV